MPPGDEAALADAVEALLEDEERRVAMGRAARVLAVERYSWSDIARRLEEIYERVADCTSRSWSVLVPLLGLVLAVSLIWWRGPDWAVVRDAFTVVRWPWVVAAIALNLLSVVVRALAWNTVLSQAMAPPRPQFRSSSRRSASACSRTSSCPAASASSPASPCSPAGCPAGRAPGRP